MSTTPEVTHKQDCPRPRVKTYTGDLGDTLTRCLACGRYVVHEEPDPEPEEVPATFATHFVCRPHYRPVTWRGKGCRLCDREMTTKGKTS